MAICQNFGHAGTLIIRSRVPAVALPQTKTPGQGRAFILGAVLLIVRFARNISLFARAFDLYDKIRFNTAVEHVAKRDDGRWLVTLSNGEKRCYRAVVCATGCKVTTKLLTGWPRCFSNSSALKLDHT